MNTQNNLLDKINTYLVERENMIEKRKDSLWCESKEFNEQVKIEESCLEKCRKQAQLS